jgi:hypothetical protein
MTLPTDLTFLALPGQAADWRPILLCGAAASTGIFDHLPATAEQLATRTGLDPQALRVVLDALGTLDVVEVAADGRFLLGAGGPAPADLPKVPHHARALVARRVVSTGGKR